MTSSKKDPVMVVLQLSGGYDAMNTIVPYADPLYLNNRKSLFVDPEQVLPIDDQVGFNPVMSPIKDLYDQGRVAVIQGIGYPNPIRSHFRSMDICIPLSLTRSGRRAGWAAPSGISIRTRRTCSRGLTSGEVSPEPWRLPAYP